MFKNERMSKAIIIALIAIFIGCCLTAIEVSAPPMQPCHETSKTNCAGDANRPGGIRTAWNLVGEFLRRNEGAITAVATIAIAIFTGTLWNATQKMMEGGEKTFKATERAFIYIDEIKPELTTALDGNSSAIDHLPDKYGSEPGLFITRFAVQPRWKNSGRTPTKKMAIQVNWSGPDGSLPTEYIYKTGPEVFFLAPNAVEASGVIEMPPAQALIDYGALGCSGPEPKIFVWGRADYEDIFGEPHFVEWCYQLRFERYDGKKVRASFILWGEHNRTDVSV